MKISDLKAASYNPRAITTSDLKRLSDSIGKFGDLSGVVFNQANKVLISGHQRLKSLSMLLNEDGFKEEIKLTKTIDDKGTVASGHILITSKNKEILRVPMRVVNWSDKVSEMAANLAANSLGGSWDKEKLKRVLMALSKKKFAVESLGFDEIFVEDFIKEAQEQDKVFPEVTKESASSRLNACCPKCKFEFEFKTSSR